MSGIRGLGDAFDELVPPVAPLTLMQCVQLGEAYGETVFGMSLRAAFDWASFIESSGGLAQYGVLVYPVSAAELDGHDAATDFGGSPDDYITVSLRVDHYEAIADTSHGGNYARSTLLHEMVHALVHVPYLRQRQPAQPHALRRFARRSIDKTRDPEWQAWTMGAAMRMPRRELQALARQGCSVGDVAERAQLSLKYTTQHLRNVSMLEIFERGARH